MEENKAIKKAIPLCYISQKEKRKKRKSVAKKIEIIYTRNRKKAKKKQK